ncbi:MAG TPA: hypothetical protein VHE30_08485 [Polyangiaceae bacterium]|nr:hypothetical protein [Polyangiaceae bacterium]
MDGKAWLDPFLSEDLVVHRLRVREPDVVFVKSILEASEGLGAVFAEPRASAFGRRITDGGDIVIAGPRSRARELRETVEDLRRELAFCVSGDPGDADPA